MLSWTKTKINQYNNRTKRTHEIVKKKKKNGNYGKSSRLASMESDPRVYFLKSEQLQMKNFKYTLQKP